MQNKVKIGLLGVGLDTYWGSLRDFFPAYWLIRRKYVRVLSRWM